MPAYWITIHENFCQVSQVVDQNTKDVTILPGVVESSIITRPNMDFSYDSGTLHILSHEHEEVVVSYLMHGIVWKAALGMYVSGDKVSIEVSARISNDFGERTADVTLLARNEARKEKIMYQKVSSQKYSQKYSQNITSSVRENELTQSDVTTFELGELVLKKYSNIPLSSQTVAYEKIYKHTLNKNNTSLSYRLKTSNYIPKGECMIFDEIYISSVDMKERQAGEEIDVLLGGTSKVRCTSSVGVAERLIKEKKNNIEEYIVQDCVASIEVNNTLTEIVTVEFSYHLDGKQISSEVPIVVKDGRAIWKLQFYPSKKTSTTLNFKLK